MHFHFATNIGDPMLHALHQLNAQLGSLKQLKGMLIGGRPASTYKNPRWRDPMHLVEARQARFPHAGDHFHKMSRDPNVEILTPDGTVICFGEYDVSLSNSPLTDYLTAMRDESNEKPLRGQLVRHSPLTDPIDRLTTVHRIHGALHASLRHTLCVPHLLQRNDSP